MQFLYRILDSGEKNRYLNCIIIFMDKRKGKRYECDIEAQISYAEIPGDFVTVKRPFKGRIKNISLKGIAIEVDNCIEIKKGMALNVEIVGNEKITCLVIVRNVSNSFGGQVICFPTSKIHKLYNELVKNAM